MKLNRFTQKIQSFKWLKMVLFSVFAVMVYLFSFNQFEERLMNNRPTQKENETSGSRVEVPALTAENVYRILIEYGVKHPEIVVKQSILETGWYKCKYCSMADNNIFGFRKNKKYIEFDNWIESVAYYKKWQDSYYKGGNYYLFLKKIGYAVSEQYETKLKSIKLDFDIAEVCHPSIHLRKLFLSFVDGLKDFGKNA
jgi:hypothetical protein